MRKRGQVTIFVVLAIVIFLGVILYFLFQSNSDSVVSENDLFVRDSLYECMDDELLILISEIGKNGGFPLNENMGYYYHLGDVRYMSFSVLSEVLEEEFLISVSNCLFFVNESYVEVSIDSDRIDIDVDIVPGSVEAIVYMDVVVSSNESSSIISFSDSPFIAESEFFEMHKAATFFADYLRDHNEAIPLTRMVSLAEESDLTFQFSEADDEVIVVLSSDKKNVPEYFVFKNKLNYDYPSEVGFLI